MNLKTTITRPYEKEPLTLAGIENILKLNGERWRGEWQVEACRAIVEHSEVIIQGPRQVFGKTFCNASAGTAMILNNHTVIIAFPTLSQGTRLLNQAISQRVNNIGPYIGGWKMRSDAMTDKWWNSRELDERYLPAVSGRLLTLTGNESTKSKPEGYTGDDLFLDEAHRYTENILGVFSPFLNIARRRRRHKLILSGVGGHKKSLIERAKSFTTQHYPNPLIFKVVRWTAKDIVNVDPSWQDTFDLDKSMLPEWQWLMNYMMEPATEGLRYMYADPLTPPSDIFLQNKHYEYIYYVGIDIGYTQDATVVTVFKKIGDIITITDHLEMVNVKVQEKVERIAAFINASCPGIDGHRIGVELNGGGFDLRDLLNDRFVGIQGITTDDTMKERFYEETVTAVRENRFGIVDPIVGDHWNGLRYELKMSQKGKKYIFEHSDHWMSACVGWQLCGHPEYKSSLLLDIVDDKKHDPKWFDSDDEFEKEAGDEL